MFDWGVRKRGVPESVWFCIGDLPMYIFLIPTYPYKLVKLQTCGFLYISVMATIRFSLLSKSVVTRKLFHFTVFF